LLKPRKATNQPNGYTVNNIERMNMKAAATVLVIALALTGCGDTKVIDGVEYDTYGLFDESDKRNPNIKYELIVGNVVWSVVLVETVVAPIYFLGFSLWEPVGLKGDHVPGVIN
jgi:hypothetical protein